MKINIDEILKIIREPVHGERFYSKETLKELLMELNRLCNSFEITEETPKSNIINIVNNYIKNNVKLRYEYFDACFERENSFDSNELIYRTAYGALVKGQAMCAGYAEAERILLSQYGIDTKTILAKLPGKEKRLLHYVVVAEYEEDGEDKCVILDPERQANCERKGKDYEKYKDTLIYMLPEPAFTNDVVGDTGVGMSALDYIKLPEVIQINGSSGVKDLVIYMNNNERTNSDEERDSDKREEI